MDAKPLVYQFDDVRIELKSFRVVKAGKPVDLEPKAFEVLVHLIENRERVVEKEKLLDAVWKDAFVTPGALTRVIAQLRKGLQDDAKDARYIETVPTRGYRFVASVLVVNGGAEMQSVSNAPPASVPNPIVRRSRWPAAIPLIMLLILAVAAGGTLLVRALAIRPAAGPSFDNIKTRQLTTWSGLDVFPTLSPDGNSVAFSSDRTGSFEIYVKSLAAGGRDLQLTSDGQENLDPAWSPNGNLIAYYSRNRGGIWVMPALGGAPRQVTEFGARPAWSRDGQSIAFQSGGSTTIRDTPESPSTIWLASLQGGKPRQITRTGNPTGGHGSPAWSPDGKRITFNSYDPGERMDVLWTVPVGGGEARRIGKGSYAVYDPAGRSIWFSSGRDASTFGVFRIPIDPQTGEPAGGAIEVKDTGPARTRPSRLALSSDGKKIAYAALILTSNLWAVSISANGDAAGKPFPLTQENSVRTAHPAYSPDGRRIAFDSFHIGSAPDLWMIDADGKNATQLTTSPASDTEPAWFPDGKRLAFKSNRDGKFKFWTLDLATGKEELLQNPGQDFAYARISPDGKTIAFNSDKNGATNIWTVALGGGSPVQLTFDKETQGWPLWSPDGKLIANEIKRGNDTHVAVMPSQGGPVTQLTTVTGENWPSSWSPDGSRIAFAGLRKNVWNVWWISADGRKSKQVTDYSGINAFVRYSVWSPLNTQIIFEFAETKGNVWLMDGSQAK